MLTRSIDCSIMRSELRFMNIVFSTSGNSMHRTARREFILSSYQFVIVASKLVDFSCSFGTLCAMSC